MVGAAAARDADRRASRWSPYYKVHTDDRIVGRAAADRHLGQRRAAPDRWRPAAVAAREASSSTARRTSASPDNPLDNVLIVGAGSGSDVAIALSKGAKHVDAVDIDPRIMEIGVEQQPRPPLRGPAGDPARQRRPGVPGDHRQEVRPDPVRAARLAGPGHRRLADPAESLPVHRAGAAARPATTSRPTARSRCTTTTARTG